MNQNYKIEVSVCFKKKYLLKNSSILQKNIYLKVLKFIQLLKNIFLAYTSLVLKNKLQNHFLTFI